MLLNMFKSWYNNNCINNDNVTVYVTWNTPNLTGASTYNYTRYTLNDTSDLNSNNNDTDDCWNIIC